MTKTDKGISIHFIMYPYLIEKGFHAVEKADNKGHKRRYLYGIASGMRTDGTGERMTKNAIHGMQDQANSGDILIYAGQHGVDHTDDIGKLVKAEITPGGDWVITNRLYDEQDGFSPGSKTLEKANKLWKQINGIPPYKKPKQYGYSIEGFIPDGGIVQMSDSGKRVIDNVELDGVLITPRPAYVQSVIQAVYKALDELPPKKVEVYKAQLQNTFSELLRAEQRETNFYTQKYKFDELFQTIIEEIMSRGDQTQDRLNLAFNEYKEVMIKLLLEHQDLFRQQVDQPTSDLGPVTFAKEHKGRTELYKALHDQTKLLYNLVKGKTQKGNKNRGRNSKSGNGARRKNNP